MNRNAPEPRDYFAHNAPALKPSDVVDCEALFAGDIEHVTLWTGENGIPHHSNTRG
jgi:hypothetical protein